MHKRRLHQVPASIEDKRFRIVFDIRQFEIARRQKRCRNLLMVSFYELGMLNFVRARNSQCLDCFLCLGAFSQICYSRRGGEQNLPNSENTKMFGFNRFYKSFNHYHRLFDAKQNPDASKHVPGLL